MSENKTNETKVYKKSASYLQSRELVVRDSTRRRRSVRFSTAHGNQSEPEPKPKHEPEPEPKNVPGTYPLGLNSTKQINTGSKPKALNTPPNQEATDELALMYSGGARKQIPSRKKSQKKKRSRKSKKN